MKKNISIKKISEITGYSVATVSRVINDMGRYSKETESKIKAVIKEYNYVPNIIAKGLRTKQIPTVGIIVPDITNEFYSRITLAAQSALFKSSYSAFICNTNEKRLLEQRHLELMRANNISGIIFVCSERLYEGDLYEEIPKVYVDRVPAVLEDKKDDYYFIESDNYEGGRLAIRELIKKGCKRIICIFEKRDISPKIARLNGTRDELIEHNLYRKDSVHYAQNIGYTDAYDIVNNLIDSGESFDGIFCYTDIIAMGAIKALYTRGISVPKAVKIVGFDDISIAAYNTPSITSVHQPMEEMGTLAADLMLKLLSTNGVKQKKYVMPVTLMQRRSTD